MYVENRIRIKARIVKIDEQIAALEDALTAGAVNADIEENFLDTGQTRSSQKLRDPNQINGAIMNLERRKQDLINQLNGNVHRAVDIKNFNPRY